jgi:hypothetical protein
MNISAISGLQSAAEKMFISIILSFNIRKNGSTLNVLQITSKRVLGYSVSRL